MTRRLRMSPIEAQETNGLKGFGFTVTWEDREDERLQRARQLKDEGRTDPEIALDIYGVADAVALSRVRDLLREEG